MLPSTLTSFCFTGCLLLITPTAARAGDDSLPDGPGKAVLQRVCNACHAPEIVVGRHESRDRWDGIVSTMIEKGAVGTDDEFNQIVEYLAANFGKNGNEPPKPEAAKPDAKDDGSKK